MKNKYSNTFTGENAYVDYDNYINGSTPGFPNIALIQSGSTAGDIIIQDTAPNDYMIYGTTTGTTDFRIGSKSFYHTVQDGNSILCHVITGDTTNYFYANAEDITGTPKFLPLGTEGKKVTAFKKFNYTKNGLTSLQSMFYGSSCTYFDANKLNTSSLTSLESAFGSFQGKKLDLSGLDVSNVTNLYKCFYSTNIEEIDVSNWNVSKVTTFEDLFRSSTKIKKIDLSSWRTPNTTNINRMFSDCYACTEIDIRNFDTRKIAYNTDVWFSFDYDYAVNKLWLGPNFFNTTCPYFDFRELHAWTNPESLEMLVTSAASHDGNGKRIYLYNNTMNAITQAQKDTLTARGWTLST